jgi:hypothetical protein
LTRCFDSCFRLELRPIRLEDDTRMEGIKDG